MGSAHILVYPDVVEKLAQHPDLTVLSTSDFGDGMLFCLVESPKLSGYSGQMNAIIIDGELSFKRDLDT